GAGKLLFEGAAYLLGLQVVDAAEQFAQFKQEANVTAKVFWAFDQVLVVDGRRLGQADGQLGPFGVAQGRHVQGDDLGALFFQVGQAVANDFFNARVDVLEEVVFDDADAQTFDVAVQSAQVGADRDIGAG